jgi:ATP-dependent RNA helicase DHX57
VSGQASSCAYAAHSSELMFLVCYCLSISIFDFLISEQVLRMVRMCLVFQTQILALGFGPIHSFISEALDQPTPEMLQCAIESLKAAGAIWQRTRNSNWELTELGGHLARMPLDVKLGRMLIYAAMFGCIEPALTIAATMSARSPFVCPFEQREAANQARESFAKDRDVSDHILYVRVFEAWCNVRPQGAGAERVWCQNNFVSIVTLKTIADMRLQFVEILVEAGFLGNKSESARHACNYNAGHLRLLRSVICAGLYPHIVRVAKPETRYVEHSAGALEQAATAKELKMFTREDGRVFLHPSSVNFKRGDFASPWLVYHSKQVRCVAMCGNHDINVRQTGAIKVSLFSLS